MVAKAKKAKESMEEQAPEQVEAQVVESPDPEAVTTEAPLEETQPEKTPEERIAELEAEVNELRGRMSDIDAANHEVTERENEVDRIKADLKEAKELYDDAVNYQNRVIREGKRTYPLFEHMEGSGEATEPEPVADESWKAVDISELRLSSKQEEKLREAGANTIGQLEDLRASDGGLHSIKGFGQKAVDAIEEAVTAWLTANRDKHLFDGGASQEAESENDEPMSPDEADEIGDSIRTTLADYEFPDAATEFLQSVEEGVNGVLDTIEKTNTVTPDQARALRNWRDGVAKWLVPA